MEAGDLARRCSCWTLGGTAPDGSAVALARRGAEVVRRQADGAWRLALDNPFAGAGD